MIQIKNQSNVWVEGVPHEGQLYRLVEDGREILQTYWAIPAISTYTKITQLGFLNRFTDDEAIDIDLASIGTTREAALLRRYLQKVNAASHIDLSRPDLLEDLGRLVQFGLLSTERVDEIINTPIAPHELFRG